MGRASGAWVSRGPAILSAPGTRVLGTHPDAEGERRRRAETRCRRRFALLFSFTLGASTLALELTIGQAVATPQKGRAPKRGSGGKKPRPPAKETKPAVKAPSAPTASPEAAPKSDLAGIPDSDLRGPTRIDFDDRLIQGQTNKSGAVYLFDRKDTGISSMVRRRKSFRQLTLGTIYDR